MTFRSLLATGLLALSLNLSYSYTAFAQDMSEAVEAYEADDYASALPVFQTLAEAGDTDAMWYLAKLHYHGWGTPESDPLAVKWWEKAAKLGDKDSQWQMGLLYERGHGVDVDQKKAFEWYLKSAENGRYSAMNELGNRYNEGAYGLKKSKKKAAKWYQKGAEGGNGDAQANLGVYYEFGHGGIKQSDKKALYWYQQSADQGVAMGQAYLGEMYASGTGVNKNLAEARRLYELAAAQDFEYAIKRLEEMGPSGQTSSATSGDEMSPEEATAFLQASIIDTKYKNAKRYAAQENYEKAFKLFHDLATENNHARSQYYVGALYEMGFGVTQSWEEAVKWTKKSAAAGDDEGEYALAVYYFNGNSALPKDRQKALELYKTSARKGFKPAQEFLTQFNITW